MKITRSLDRDGTLGPLALNYLGEIPEKYLFFREQQLRHPASLYNMSLEKLTKAFVAVGERYTQDTTRFSVEPQGGFDLKALLDAQEHLLRCLQEHLADCYLILRTLVDPATTGSTNIQADQYVIESKLPGAKEFMQATADYRTSLKIADKIKHNQSRLRGIGVYPGDGVCLGYYLEEPDKAGVLGPSGELHPNQGAFSFTRDLKWRFFLVYSLSENLVKAVGRALKRLHQTTLDRAAPPQRPSDDWKLLVAAIAKIPRAIFPKELDVNIATIQLTGEARELTLKFPDRARIVYPSLLGRAVVSTTVDGFSPHFKVPLP